MRKTLFVLCLLAAVGVGAWRFLAPPPAPRSPIEKLRAASPMETVRAPRVAPTAAPVVRAAPPAPKQDEKRTRMEERFTDLKEEGRRIREALLQSDPKAAQAYTAISQRPEYRELIDRRHKIESAWASAPEDEREGMLTEMNSLRQQGIGMLMAEIQRMNSQPESNTLQRTSPGTLTLTPSSNGAAPAPAPAPPVVFQ